ncbi:MAG: hypothetical protein WCA41_00405, partial [Candidatus Acidiferrum sp.]
MPSPVSPEDAFSEVGNWLIVMPVPGVGPVRMVLGQEAGHMGGGSPTGSPVTKKRPEITEVPTALN